MEERQEPSPWLVLLELEPLKANRLELQRPSYSKELAGSSRSS